MWPSFWKWSFLASQMVWDVTNPNKPCKKILVWLRDTWTIAFPVWLWPFGLTMQPFVSAWPLKSSGSTPQIPKLNVLLRRLKGANRVLVALMQLCNIISQRPVLNPGLHFCPEKSPKCQGTINVWSFGIIKGREICWSSTSEKKKTQAGESFVS